jgi:hypothetical protein
MGAIADEAAAPNEDLTPDQRAWALHSEELRRRAVAIVSGRPDLDPGDVYHALRTLELAPEERLHRGLPRVRVRPHGR